MIGQTIGHFEVVSHLGSGGMGEVWLAEQQSIGTRVAIKLLHASISKDAEHVQRFFNEARAVSRIQHAGIVKIFDVGHHAGQAYLIMEHLEGETLLQRLKRVGRLPYRQVADIGSQLANVLDATHSVGVVHRDLKPDNVFLVPDRELGERVKVLDFGIAKLTGTIAGVSPKTIGTMGTPAYMAPEQWGDTSKVDWRADLYSLGCLAFEMTCGRPPFVAENIAEACGKHLNEQAPRASSLTPTVPAKLEQLLALLLAKDPAARPASMREVARAFELVDKQALGAALTLPVAAVSLPAPAMTRAKRSLSIAPILLGVSVLAGGASGAVLFLRDSSRPRDVTEPQPSARVVAPRADVTAAPQRTTVDSERSQEESSPVSVSPKATTPPKPAAVAPSATPSTAPQAAMPANTRAAPPIPAATPPTRPQPAAPPATRPATAPATGSATPPVTRPPTSPSASPPTSPTTTRPTASRTTAPPTTTPTTPPPNQSPTRPTPRSTVDAGMPPTPKDAETAPNGSSKHTNPDTAVPGSGDDAADGSADAEAPH